MFSVRYWLQFDMVFLRIDIEYIKLYCQKFECTFYIISLWPRIHLTPDFTNTAAEKERKKQKEKEKKERQKREGTYMTKKQKQQAAIAQQRLEAMRAAGMEVSLFIKIYAYDLSTSYYVHICTHILYTPH